MAKIVFFGTPDYVVPIADLLSKYHKIEAVVTKPPAVVGREEFKEFSPIDTWAHGKKIPIYFEPAKIVERNLDVELGIVASYGEIIPNNVLNYLKYGLLNVHPSLLPKWRGSSPIPASIIAGDKETGVSIIKLDNGLDHGPIVSKFKRDLEPNDNSDSLRKELFERSAQFLIDLIPSYLDKKMLSKDQDHDKATFCTTVKKDDGFIEPKFLAAALEGKTAEGEWKIRFMRDFEVTPDASGVDRFIRALSPWPQAWSKVKIEGERRRIKILKAHLDADKLVLDEVQLEGKNPVSYNQFKEGYASAIFE